MLILEDWLRLWPGLVDIGDLIVGSLWPMLFAVTAGIDDVEKEEETAVDVAENE